MTDMFSSFLENFFPSRLSSRVDQEIFPSLEGNFITPDHATFKALAVGSESTAQIFTIANPTPIAVPLASIECNGSFALTTNAPVGGVMPPNSTYKVVVVFAPTSGGPNVGNIVINYGHKPKEKTVWLRGVGIGKSNPDPEPTLPIITIGNGVIVEISDSVIITLSDGIIVTISDSLSLTPTSVDFGKVIIGSVSIIKEVTVTNNSNSDLTLDSVSVALPFSLTKDSINTESVILAKGSGTLKIQYNPTVSGSSSQNLTITTGSESFTLALSGSAISSSNLDKIKIVGNQFVNATTNTPIRLKSVNWFGAEGNNYTPHGTWTRKWSDLLDQIKAWGFNCIRLPMSGSLVNNPTPPATAIDAISNPDLVGLSSLAILDMYLDYCNKIGLYVVLDHHVRVASSNTGGSDGSPIDSSYTMDDWKKFWTTMGARWKDHPAVIGADLHNEPHSLTWSVWAGYVEECAEALLAVAPDWLIFVEGVGSSDDQSDSTWWGGYLKGVATRPISLSIANKVAYSPHEYGQSVGGQSWLSTDNNAVANYPKNLYAVWDNYWGYIYKQNIAPIWIGEFGGKFGVDGSGNSGQANAVPETQWVDTLIQYLNGDFNGDGVNDLTSGNKGLSFSYWSMNPNSSDTGGLLEDDWVTSQTVKLNILKPLLDA